MGAGRQSLLSEVTLLGGGRSEICAQSPEEQPCRGGRKGPGCQAAEGARVGVELPGRRAERVVGPGAGEGHPFQLSFPVIRTPGVGGELPLSTGWGASAGCSPSGKVPTKRGVWRCS